MIVAGKTHKLKIFAFCLASLLLYGSAIHAAHDAAKSLRGPAFSDPTKHMQMPASWEEQPVKYESSAGDVSLAINLDQQMYRVLTPTIKEYAKKHGLNIAITDSTCGNSAGMLRRKMIDIGGFCCAPGMIDRFPGLRFHTTGIAPVALFVHPDNPIDNITLDQARRIFMGKINYWSELKTSDGRPGPEVMIKTVGRLHCKTRPGHWRLLLDNEDLFSSRMFEVGNISDMILQVASNTDAIGHETAWLATEYYKDRGRVKTLKIDGYAPEDLDALLSGKYPVYKTFSVTTWEGKETKNSVAGELVKFIKNQIETLDAGYGIVPISRLKKSGWKFKGSELIGEPELNN